MEEMLALSYFRHKVFWKLSPVTYVNIFESVPVLLILLVSLILSRKTADAAAHHASHIYCGQSPPVPYGPNQQSSLTRA